MGVHVRYEHGVLQVLALVQRHGSELGGPGPELAELAGQQETALRNLLRRRPTAGGNTREYLRTELVALGSPAIDVATPADPLMLPTRSDLAVDIGRDSR